MKNEIHNIGTPGKAGFGVAAIKDKDLKADWIKLAGHNDITSENYGNVHDASGSVMVWVPAFYFKWTNKNKCKISSSPKNGYVLHRAFIDGGEEQKGFFIDKYECGNDAGIFSSKEGMEPCGTYGDKSISKLSNAPSSNLGGLYMAPKTRGDEYALATIFMWNAIGMLSYANNGNFLKNINFHNNSACGVKTVNTYRLEVAGGFTKLNNDNSIFKIIKHSVSAKDIMSEDDTYNEKFYDDLDLAGVIDKNEEWAYLSDKTKTFKMSNDTQSEAYIKTCMGIPRKKALSSDYNKRFCGDGIYRYLRSEMAPIVGGYWGDTSAAGVFTLYVGGPRTVSSNTVGGRASVYL